MILSLGYKGDPFSIYSGLGLKYLLEMGDIGNSISFWLSCWSERGIHFL